MLESCSKKRLAPLAASKHGLGLDLGEAIDARRVGVDGRFGRHRPATGRDSQITKFSGSFLASVQVSLRSALA
jgi:hypothetical protein